MPNLLEYADKHVNVTYLDEGENKTITGLVTKANAMAILVRPRGKQFVLVDAESIASITEIDSPVKVPRIKVRSMEKILTDQVRQHLADRHGLSLGLIPDGADEAEKLHDQIDHSKLGHHHRPDVDEVAERAAALGAVTDMVKATEDEDPDPSCEHGGCECESPCPCGCDDCKNDIDEED